MLRDFSRIVSEHDEISNLCTGMLDTPPRVEITGVEFYRAFVTRKSATKRSARFAVGFTVCFFVLKNFKFSELRSVGDKVLFRVLKIPMPRDWWSAIEVSRDVIRVLDKIKEKKDL